MGLLSLDVMRSLTSWRVQRWCSRLMGLFLPVHGPQFAVEGFCFVPSGMTYPLLVDVGPCHFSIDLPCFFLSNLLHLCLEGWIIAICSSAIRSLLALFLVDTIVVGDDLLLKIEYYLDPTVGANCTCMN